MEGRRGPTIQGANMAFRVEDCAALELEAMRAALEDARQRATRMAGLLDMSLGRVISVSEDVSPVGAIRPAGGCIAHAGQTATGGYYLMGTPQFTRQLPHPRWKWRSCLRPRSLWRSKERLVLDRPLPFWERGRDARAPSFFNPFYSSKFPHEKSSNSQRTNGLRVRLACKGIGDERPREIHVRPARFS